MAERIKLRLGSEVVATDGSAGQLKRFIVDPEAFAVTHLDVASPHHDDGHLVPVDHVESADAHVHLSCTLEEFSQLERDVSIEHVSALSSGGYDSKALLQMPFFGMGGATIGAAAEIRTDTIPEGEVDLSRRASVSASDGHVGHVNGLCIDAVDHAITHLLLGEGHLFGSREVAIPVDLVAAVSAEGVQLSASKPEVEALPSLED